jgi:hypothetical protein
MIIEKKKFFMLLKLDKIDFTLILDSHEKLQLYDYFSYFQFNLHGEIQNN